MSRRVTVVDYGSGNLFSVARALETCGATVTLCGTPEGIRAADRLVLPGVGAFATGMRGLQTRGLDEAVVRYAALERPLLGICLGMQMLFDHSSEFGHHVGLGLIAGRIDAIEPGLAHGRPLKVPLRRHRTRRPGQHRLLTAISIAADPGPASPMIFSLRVWNA